MASTCRLATLAMQVRTLYLIAYMPDSSKMIYFTTNCSLSCPFQASAWPRICRAVRGASSPPAQRRAFSSRWAASTAAWATCPPFTQRHRATLEQGTLHHTYFTTQQSNSLHSHLVTLGSPLLYLLFPFFSHIANHTHLALITTYLAARWMVNRQDETDVKMSGVSQFRCLGRASLADTIWTAMIHMTCFMVQAGNKQRFPTCISDVSSLVADVFQP